MENLDYGVIGNGKSAALVSKSGSIDWCCLPVFDSRSVFAKILDVERGGSFSVEPTGDYTVHQQYVRRTNILRTRFTADDWEFDLLDFMPRYRTDERDYYCPPDIIRYFRPVRGTPKIRLRYEPRLAYARHATEFQIRYGYLKAYTEGEPYESLYLYSDFVLEDIENANEVVLDDEYFVMLSYNQKLEAPNISSVLLQYEQTKVYWMNWIAESHYTGPYADAIERSSLVMKLLAYQKTGAVIAALTTSIPEKIGSGRNWDYRFCWLRDASMIIRVFTDLRHYNVGRRFLQFILDIVPYKDEKVQIMYGIHGEKNLEERTLSWLSGYENSGPVRVGNAAYTQKQNDIYGIVMDMVYQKLSVSENTLATREELWTVVRTLVRHVQQNWHSADAGIWEIRGERKHFVLSKVLCWVAIDRAVKIADLLNRSGYVESWSALRDEIRADIMENGWSAKLGSFTQAYGDENLDASNLLIEHYGFLEASDPKYTSTVRETYKHLSRDGLMYRYRNHDDFGEPETSFTVCTFWMIKSLFRIGERDKAVEMFEQLLTRGNHLGLFSEDIEFDTGRLLGNFPQGYSHLALIDTAITLSGGASSLS